MVRTARRRPVAAAGALLIAFLAPCASLQMASSPERPIALYRAPSPYKEPGRPALSSLIVTSRPVHVNKAEQGVETEERRVNPASWRRQLFISTSLGTGAVPVPTTDSSIQHVSIECAKGQACSTTIPLRPSTPSTATFKPYSQEALHKFLTDFATVTTAGNSSIPGEAMMSNPPPPPVHQAYVSQSQPQQVDPEPTNRLANLYLEEPTGDSNVGDDRNGSTRSPSDKSVGWSLLHAQQHKHPYDDRQGWVSLEPVPWSTSHVSKWQSNVQPSRPWDDTSRPSGGTSPWNDLERPHGSTYNYGNGGSGGKPWNNDRPWNSGPPQNSKPWENNNPSGGNWGSQTNKWDRPTDGRRPGGDPWPTTGSPGDLITDGGSPDFPPHQSGYTSRPGGNDGPSSRPPSRPWDSDYQNQRRPPGRHPATHPEEGDGTWVLLSSTRGYSTPPRHRGINQRALTLSTTRSVRLTVLPADNTTNTTTSHGGMLEVEDSEQSVDESAMLQHALADHHNTTLSSYEHFVREAQRVHAASVLKQALANRNLANATALNDIIGVAAAMAAGNLPTKAHLTATAAPTTTSPRPTGSTKVKRRKVSKTKPRGSAALQAASTEVEPHAVKPNFTGRADGSTVAYKRGRVLRLLSPADAWA